MKPLPHPNKLSSLFDAAKNNAIDKTLLAEIAIGLWRMRNSLVLETLSSSDVQATRTWKHLQRLLTRMERAGVRIQDKKGEPYDAGMALRVVSVEKRADLKSQMIIETLTPTVFHGDTLLHAGEVVIGKPEIS
jgi:hypothetical protein